MTERIIMINTYQKVSVLTEKKNLHYILWNLNVNIFISIKNYARSNKSYMR